MRLPLTPRSTLSSEFVSAGLSFQGVSEPPQLKHIMCFMLFYVIRGDKLGLNMIKPNEKGAEIRLLCPLESLYGGIIPEKNLARPGQDKSLGGPRPRILCLSRPPGHWTSFKPPRLKGILPSVPHQALRDIAQGDRPPKLCALVAVGDARQFTYFSKNGCPGVVCQGTEFVSATWAVVGADANCTSSKPELAETQTKKQATIEREPF